MRICLCCILTGCAEGFNGTAPNCNQCKPGYGYEAADTDKAHACRKCPRGYYSVGGAYNTTYCEACPIGYTTPYSLSNAATSRDQCTGEVCWGKAAMEQPVMCSLPKLLSCGALATVLVVLGTKRCVLEDAAYASQ